LFSRAAQMSWPCPAGLALAAAEAEGDQLAQAVGCTNGDVAGCLRATDFNRLATVFPPFGAPHVPSTAVIDGALLPDTPANLIAQRLHNQMPVLVSTTSEEYQSLLTSIGVTGPVTAEVFASTVRRKFPNHAPAILAHYPLSGFETPLSALVAVFSDGRVTCPARRDARALFAAQEAPVRRYLYTHRFDEGPEARFGAAHAFDLPFVFHNLAFTTFQPSANEVALADAMSDAMVRFASTGDPDGGPLPAWPASGPDGNDAMVFDETIELTPSRGAVDCDFWDSLGI
jgi:para-nitrobenzyl esterase